MATCKYLTTHQVSRPASVVQVSASFIGIIFSVTVYYWLGNVGQSRDVSKDVLCEVSLTFCTVNSNFLKVDLSEVSPHRFWHCCRQGVTTNDTWVKNTGIIYTVAFKQFFLLIGPSCPKGCVTINKFEFLARRWPVGLRAELGRYSQYLPVDTLQLRHICFYYKHNARFFGVERSIFRLERSSSN